MPPALNAAKVLSGCFRHFARALKAHRFLERGIAAQVAQQQAAIPALYNDKTRIDRVKMKTLVLGLGNPILSDDAVGIRIAEGLKEKTSMQDVISTSEAGIALLDYAAGYDKLVIIDSVMTEAGKPGELYKLELEDLKPGMGLPSSHGLDIATAFNLGEKLGYPVPRQVTIYAVEIADNTTLGERCTQEVEERIPFIVRQIVEEERL
jgi:hydrogenase maturation protease